MIKKFALSILLSGIGLAGAMAQVVATDNYESGTFALDGSYNGGSGFGALTYLAGVGGGVYNDTDGSQIDDTQSLGLYPGPDAGNTQEIGRAITTPVTIGTYSVDGRFNLDNSAGFSGFNIKSGLGGSFGANELMSFGLVPSSSSTFLITDSSGTHTLTVGTDTELRGPAFNFLVSFDTTAGTYTVTATDKGNGQTGTISGSLETSGSVGAIGFANLDTGGSHNLIIDNTVVTAVPEPATVLLVGPAVLSGLFFMRRRRS